MPMLLCMFMYCIVRCCQDVGKPIKPSDGGGIHASEIKTNHADKGVRTMWR